MKTLIVDDEKRARNILRILIEKNFPELLPLKEAASGAEALDHIVTTKPDLVFLDVEMPGMNAFDLLSSLPTHDFSIIFTTAYNHYAVKAIKFSALDYLLKPIQIDELTEAVDRFHQHQQIREKLFENFIENLKSQEKKLAIPTEQGVNFLKVDQIIRCEAQINYTKFHLSDGGKFLSSKTLKEYDDALAEDGFIRVHRSHLVNEKYIGYYDRTGFVRLTNGEKIPVSRRKKSNLIPYIKKE